MVYYDLRKDELFSWEYEWGKHFSGRTIHKKVFVARYIEKGRLGIGMSDDGEEALKLAKKCCVGKGWSIEPVSKSNRFSMKDFFDEEIVEWCETLWKDMEGLKRRVKLSYGIEKRSYEDCNGITYSKTICYGTFSVWGLKAKPRREEGYESIYFFEKPSFEELESVVKKVLERIEHKMKAKPVRSGRYDVILHPNVGSVFAHEALGHLFEADQKKSILKNKEGKTIAPEWFSLWDNPLKKGFGFYPFDDDGCEAKQTCLVKEGKIVDYLRDRLNGGCGNGRAAIGKPILVRMSNTYIGEGDATLEEMLEGFTGYLFLQTLGGCTHPETGEYRFSVDHGYWIENGEIKEKVKGGIMAGKTLELLEKVDMVGKEVIMEKMAGMCGKDGQLVRVSGGAPYLRLRDYVVG